jgi:formylglycine-generating enzyme required for sulfatase activity
MLKQLHPRKASEKQLRHARRKKDEDRTARNQKPLTWKDPKTGLEWQFQSPGEMSWYEAQEYARSLSLGGKKDWRLPTAAELDTLLDRKTLFDKIRPDMRKEVPFRDTLSYWSSTTFAENTNNAWIVMFDGAYVLSYYKTNSYYVRCVRGRVESKRETIDLVLQNLI